MFYLNYYAGVIDYKSVLHTSFPSNSKITSIGQSDFYLLIFYTWPKISLLEAPLIARF
jgi:hypothetical protein